MPLRRRGSVAHPICGWAGCCAPLRGLIDALFHLFLQALHVDARLPTPGGEGDEHQKQRGQVFHGNEQEGWSVGLVRIVEVAPGRGISRVQRFVTVCNRRGARRGECVNLGSGHERREQRMASIWVIDDDDALRALLVRYLGEQGFAVRGLADGAALQSALSEGGMPDVFLLDLMLPGEDGLSLARRLRAQGDTPIIMLSARGEDLDRIIGLEMGADDYLTKPFNPRELLARIRAVLRRTAGRESAQEKSAAWLAQGAFRMNQETHQFWLHEREIVLTEGEFQLLRVFMQQPRRLLSRDVLLDAVRGLEHTPFDRSMDVRVTRLRRKIEPDPAHPRYLLTIRGEGYVFMPEGRAA